MNPYAPHDPLRHQSLFDGGRGYSFPCSPAVPVDLDSLIDGGRITYVHAPAVAGRERALPAVVVVPVAH